MKKAKVIDLANRIKNKERHGRAEVIVVPNDGTEEFWSLLGGQGKIRTASVKALDEEDEKEDKKPAAEKFVRFSLNEDQTVLKEELSVAKLDRHILHTETCFVLDTVSEL